MLETAYTSRQRVLAVNLSAVLGWAAYIGPDVVGSWYVLPLLALYGLPIAFAACWLVAAPILWRLMRHQISWPSAAGWGAAISGMMAAIGVALSLLSGWCASQNPNFHYQLGGGDFVREIDGVLTPYGWRILAQSTATFVLSGIAVALLVRAVIGPGRPRAGEWQP